jgi:N-acetylglutamate synthase-like GNAT family acetyltransferase
MWDWGVGEIVAKRLSDNAFNDWESIVVATINSQYAGLCIIEKKDDWGTDLDIALTPFITAVYVDPKFRGRRISEKLLITACDFLRALRFDTVYLISSQKGFYEKFGFKKFTQTVTTLGTTEPVYKKCL